MVFNNQELAGSGFRTHTCSESDVVVINHRVIETLKGTELLIIQSTRYSLNIVNTLAFALPKTEDKV